MMRTRTSSRAGPGSRISHPDVHRLRCHARHRAPYYRDGPKGSPVLPLHPRPHHQGVGRAGDPRRAGRPPALQNPQGWFDNLTPYSQLDVMGRSQARLDAYLNGKVQWHELAATKHTPAWRDSIIPVPVRNLPTRSKTRRAAA